MVARSLEMGLSQGTAIGLMTFVAIIGLFGSYIVGVFDDKLGTKKAMLGFSVFYFLAGFINWLSSIAGGNLALYYLSVAMIGIGIGGSANFTTSLAASVFGRHGFDKVNSVLFPLQALVTALNFLVSGLIRIITGNSLMWVFLCGGIVCLIDIPVLLLFIKDEHKYNKDYQVNN